MKTTIENAVTVPPVMKVLIVEDEGIVALDLKRRLEKQGFAVTGIADNAIDALRLVEQSPPDLVLMDIILQGELDGIATAREVRVRHDIPVVFLTAHSDSATVQRAKSALAYGYLIKPFEERELLTTIEIAVCLHQNESRQRLYERAIGATTSGIIITDPRQPDNPIISCNTAFERITGYTEAEVVGKSPRFLQGPDTVPLANQIISAAVNEGRDCQVILLHYRKDGTTFWDEVNLSPVRDASGLLTNFIGIHNDITEKRQATNRIRQQARLIEQAGDAIFVCDLKNHVTLWNPAAKELYGFNEKEVLQQSIWDRICPETEGDMLDKILQKVHCSGEWNGEMLHCTKDGHPLIIQTRFTLLEDEKSTATGFLVVNHDLTSQRKLERQITRSQRQETLGALAGGIAHDLNNALAPILMGLELLRVECPGDSEIIDLFESSAGRAADMVRQLLTFARGAEGQRGQIQTSHLLNEMRGIIQSTFPKSIKVTCVYEKDLPPVIGDATQLHQVLLNLCVNARDAMPDGGTLALMAKQVEVGAVLGSRSLNGRAGHFVALTVADTGTGIPPEVRDRIFDPFFTTKDPGKGTGIGLSTSIGIVKSHEGFIEVDSESAQGTTFTVYLPTEKRISPTIPETRVGTQFRGDGETILFVDDELGVQNLARAVLQQMNCKVVLASDGIEGMQWLTENRSVPSAIITDLDMPNQDGLAFINSLRKILPDIPIVLSSGLLDDGKKRELEVLGVTAFLNKPYSSDQLAGVMKGLFAPGNATRQPAEPARLHPLLLSGVSNDLYS